MKRDDWWELGQAAARQEATATELARIAGVTAPTIAEYAHRFLKTRNGYSHLRFMDYLRVPNMGRLRAVQRMYADMGAVGTDPISRRFDALEERIRKLEMDLSREKAP